MPRHVAAAGKAEGLAAWQAGGRGGADSRSGERIGRVQCMQTQLGGQQPIRSTAAAARAAGVGACMSVV